MGLPELIAVQSEYEGSPVPLALPALRGVHIEYKGLPVGSGLIIGGEVVTIVPRASIANQPLVHRMITSEVLGIAAVAAEPNFDAGVKWKYLLVQYLHRDSGEIKNIIHGEVGANWEGTVSWAANAALGEWDKRAMILRAKTGEELVLGPSTFLDGESLVMVV